MLLKIGQREKRFLLTGAVVVFLIVIYYVGMWYIDIRSSAREYVEAKRITLEKQLNKISKKDFIQKRAELLAKDLKSLNRGLLSGNKAPVAAAEIQKILKKIALSLDINITMERALKPVDYGLYLGIPVEIGFTTTTKKMAEMLYEIKTSALLLTVSEMRTRVINLKNPTNATSTLIVKGFIMKSRMPEEEKKDGANVS